MNERKVRGHSDVVVMAVGVGTMRTKTKGLISAMLVIAVSNGMAGLKNGRRQCGK